MKVWHLETQISLQRTAIFCFLFYSFLSSNKRKIYGNPPKGLWGWGKSREQPRTLKIELYSRYDILVMMFVVRLLSSYIFVDFPIKWLYYCQLWNWHLYFPMLYYYHYIIPAHLLKIWDTELGAGQAIH